MFVKHKRRALLKVAAGAGTVAVSAVWSKPIVQSVLLPAHAQATLSGIGVGVPAGTQTSRCAPVGESELYLEERLSPEPPRVELTCVTNGGTGVPHYRLDFGNFINDFFSVWPFSFVQPRPRYRLTSIVLTNPEHELVSHSSNDFPTAFQEPGVYALDVTVAQPGLSCSESSETTFSAGEILITVEDDCGGSVQRTWTIRDI